MFPGNAQSVLGCIRCLPLLAITGCFQGMADQPKYEPFEQCSFFANGEASRPLVSGTIARGHLQIDDHFYTGRVDGQLVTTFPHPVTEQALARGRQRYDVFCAPCHDRVGNGQGMVVQRGFPRPLSFHVDRLRDASVGHFFEVISKGFGRMPDYAAQIPAKDRWAIVAYVRALQLSQHAERAKLTDNDLRRLDSEMPSTLNEHK